ncbi:TPA: hypothetical protein JG825_003515 [Vibrio parahaemolyticus]|uniref:hypothetical protein n=1 Tax=Vibrio harveyi group TaxID=717610 RepID=UPI0018F16E74|nr:MULTISPECIES: hypothetical protein [Vibrio harveyi group]MCR9909728.1 hypothetical protein [Vibrio campbellii]UPR19023.1 hypothetical protein H9J99_26105 [Vibrio parahaemolyticus]HAV1520196.1 hypothetical protein [Vibrio parahaemolyticus]HAV1539162.1 hypothetical protein [Vibrio parahaemolyticus]
MKFEVITVTKEFVECRYKDPNHNVVTIMTVELVGSKRILFKDYFRDSAYNLRSDMVRWWVANGIAIAEAMPCERECNLQEPHTRHLAYDLNEDAAPFMKRIYDRFTRKRPTNKAWLDSPTRQRLEDVFSRV